MTKFPHDQFAKEYLQELLSPLGQVETSKDVTAEVREIDIFFQPVSENREYAQSLGLLGKIATTVALIEPFRNPVTVEGIFSGVSKLLNTRAEVLRKANREQQGLTPSQLPFLWILTPTASEGLLKSFGFQTPEASEDWPSGVYLLSEVWRVGLIAIHQLPDRPDTLWLRMLGKGRVQQKAIAQLTQLSVDNPLRANALELLYNLQANLQANLANSPEGNEEDRELVMAITPLFQEQLQAAQQKGIEQGIEQGLQQGIEQGIERGLQQGIEQGIAQGIAQGIERGRQEQQRLILENLFQARFGEADEKATAFISRLSTVSAAELTGILLGLSRLTADEEGRQQAMRVLAESVLQLRGTEFGDRLPTMVTNLLDLPIEQLTFLLEQLPHLSTDELIEQLGQRQE